MDIKKRKRLPVSISAAVFIQDNQGRLLLLQQAAESKGYRWGPPAGGMEAHEDPMIAALREVKEEIGIEAELIDLVGIYTVDRGDDASGIAFVFRGKIVSGQITPKEDEIQSFQFFTLKEMENLIKEDMLYKPEYNVSGIKDWSEGKSYSLEMIKRLGS